MRYLQVRVRVLMTVRISLFIFTSCFRFRFSFSFSRLIRRIMSVRIVIFNLVSRWCLRAILFSCFSRFLSCFCRRLYGLYLMFILIIMSSDSPSISVYWRADFLLLNVEQENFVMMYEVLSISRWSALV